eukprot:4652922-Amphidinium_carterae.1
MAWLWAVNRPWSKPPAAAMILFPWGTSEGNPTLTTERIAHMADTFERNGTTSRRQPIIQFTSGEKNNSTCNGSVRVL